MVCLLLYPIALRTLIVFRLLEEWLESPAMLREDTVPLGFVSPSCVPLFQAVQNEPRMGTFLAHQEFLSPSTGRWRRDGG